jgi:hypothetical protein
MLVPVGIVAALHYLETGDAPQGADAHGAPFAADGKLKLGHEG